MTAIDGTIPEEMLPANIKAELNKGIEDKLDGPCACGKRQVSRPQFPMSQMRYSKDFEFFRAKCDFRCGECNEIHQLCSVTIAEQLSKEPKRE